MKPLLVRGSVFLLTLALPLLLYAAPELKQKTRDEWKNYIDLTEKRIEAELKLTPIRLRTDVAQLKSGKIYKDKLTTPGANKDISDGTIHHWLGAVFIPNMRLEKLIPWLQNYAQYQDYFTDLEQSKMLSRSGDEFEIFLRMRRSKAGVTAHFNTKHRVVYSRRTPGFLSAASRSTEILQVKNAGKPSESLYPAGNDDGYLWGLNSYWRYIEHEGGVVVECETVGLSRDLGSILGILNFFTLNRIKSAAESIAKDALDETLTGLRNGATGGPKKSSR